MAETCGAKTRSGEPCKRAPVPGKTRCKLHGGLSTGALTANQNARTHGIYSTLLTDEEKADADTVEIGNIDILIKLAHIQLKRAWAAKNAAMNRPELDEVIISEQGQTHKQKVVDYDAKIDKIMARIAHLEEQRKALTDNASAEQIITIRGGF